MQPVLETTFLTRIAYPQFTILRTSGVYVKGKATNCDLARVVEQGRFRADLFHRLVVMRIELPPLRDRNDRIMKRPSQFIIEDEISRSTAGPDQFAGTGPGAAARALASTYGPSGITATDAPGRSERASASTAPSAVRYALPQSVG